MFANNYQRIEETDELDYTPESCTVNKNKSSLI